MPPLLRVNELHVEVPSGQTTVSVVRGASFEIAAGEILGLVGESGSGKSLTALSVLRLLPPGSLCRGRIELEGRDLLTVSERDLRRVRGGRIGLVFQEPMTALNPCLSVGGHVVEAIRCHRDLSRRAAREEAIRLLELVALPDPRARFSSYPHQLSGGQRQRALLAAALGGGPSLLLADEPTTALDVTLQAQMLELLLDLRQRLGLAVLLISHDLGVIAETCDRVLVMYAGRIVEAGPVRRVLERPAHPYTRALLDALPVLGQPFPRGAMPSIPGAVPEPGRLPAGCAFHPRCGRAEPRCRSVDPESHAPEPGREVRCHVPYEVAS